MPNSISRIVISAPHSGSGKTTITAGLIAALTQRGYCIQPFKVGPDYIDPTYHTLASKRTCRNLDSWMLPNGQWQGIFERSTRDADGAIVEGVMGLYDGANYENEIGSTAEIAKQLNAPVVIVMDASKMARSAGAIALGLIKFDPELQVIGFIVNRVGSESHGRGVAASIKAATGKPCFGWIPRDARVSIPERQLGLTPTGESVHAHEIVETARELVEKYLDVDQILPLSEPSTSFSENRDESQSNISAPKDVVIAVARDEAFSFTYPENLELLEEAGAQIAFFSPLRDSALPTGTNGIILSGGFPEVYAAQLSANELMRNSLKDAHAKNLPILAECGGLMYLTESIREINGTIWPMAGLLPGTSTMTKKLTLGYRLAEAACNGPMLCAGENVRGHEFHYSVWENRPVGLQPAFILHPRDGSRDPKKIDGCMIGNLWATYIHTHFLNAPEMATRFVESCRNKK